jgi:hypothetical protein
MKTTWPKNFLRELNAAKGIDSLGRSARLSIDSDTEWRNGSRGLPFVDRIFMHGNLPRSLTQIVGSLDQSVAPGI